MMRLLFEQCPESHLRTANKLLNGLVVYHPILQANILIAFVFHCDENLANKETKQVLCVLRKTLQNEGDTFAAIDAL